jgi:hypothetical protein
MALIFDVFVNLKFIFDKLLFIGSYGILHKDILIKIKQLIFGAAGNLLQNSAEIGVLLELRIVDYCYINLLERLAACNV